MSDDKIKILERALLRERKARKDSEEILEQKSLELYEVNKKLSSSNRMLETLLDDSSSQLNIIVENSSIGIFLTRNGKLVKTNTFFQEITGFTEKELLNRTIKEITHDDDFAITDVELQKMESGEIDQFSIKKRYRHKNGSTVLCKSNVTAVRDSSGSTKYHVALIEDITDIESKSRMLRALNALSVSILGKTDIFEIGWEIAKIVADHLGLEDCVVYTVDQDTKVIQPVAAYGNKNPKGHDIKHDMVFEIGKGIVGAVALSGKPEIVNDTTIDKRYILDGEERLSELVVPIIVDNRVIGILDSENSNKNYFHDEHLETFVNIANLAAAQFNNAINLVKRNDAEKQKNKLLRDLEQSNKELNNYAHVVSHDLKSPLRSMSSLISWIQEDNASNFDGETNKNFELLLNKVDKMDHLIEGILRYSTIDKIHQQIENVDLNLVIDDILAIIDIPKHIRVAVTTDNMPIVQGDRFRLQQLFQNIISNAVKYIDKEEGFVNIACEDMDDYYLFSIADNGIGIDEKYHKKIFQVFQILEENENSSTGIGLSIVKKIVELYSGKVWVESKKDLGTTFYFTLNKSQEE